MSHKPGIIGYSDSLSASAGDTLEFKVSSRGSGDCRAKLVRILYADPNPHGPGLQEQDLAHVFTTTFACRSQPVSLGSYGIVKGPASAAAVACFTLCATIWVTRPPASLQGILGSYDFAGRSGVSIALDAENGLLAYVAGLDGPIRLAGPLQARTWYRVWLSCDAAQGRIILGLLPLHSDADDRGHTTTLQSVALEPLCIDDTFLIAALHDSGQPVCHFNGKIERPRIFTAALSNTDIEELDSRVDNFELLADWDFSSHMQSFQFSDRGPYQLHGTLVNAPSRAMTGSNWNGTEMCWRHAPQQYGAAHFHDDDIHDCAWETDFQFAVPHDLPAGVYGMRLQCAAGDDVIPFYVTPSKRRRRTDVCVLIPTFTYVAYGNHAKGATDDLYMDRARAWGARTFTPDNVPDYGLSTYNVHSDGSGVAYASRLRPMINFRPNYITYADDAVGSGVHHFAADCYLLSWLEQRGFSFDITTDDELHAEGVSLLQGYRVVLTTSHPEYHTAATLDAISRYTHRGGRFMYLGGNGFYWRVGINDDIPGLIEIRRNETGIRAWITEPGEFYHSLDGCYGGLWLRNARAPQSIAGVGFTAYGKFRASYYRRTARSYEPDVSWVFEGIDEAIIGDFGFAAGGAAGYELDRVDHALGTPANVIVLAKSENHDATMEPVYEDRLWLEYTTTGDAPADLVRADMVIYDLPGGGKVFSVGSITYTGSLPWNGYRNNISRLTENVLRRYLANG